MEGDQNYWQEWLRRRMSRRSMLRRAGLTGLVVAGSSSLWACGESQAPKAAEPTPAPATTKPAATPTPVPPAGPKRGGTLRIGANKELNFNILDPHTSFYGYDETYLRSIFDYLVNYDDTLAYSPGWSLAESWEAVDDVTLLFKLRKGVKFTDGTEWNSQVLKFNIDRIGNPDVKSPRAYALASVKSVDYPDNYTCKIILKEPMASFFGEVAHGGFGITTPANVAKWDPKELGRHPVGSGPFTLTEALSDDHYTLTKNKDFWRKDDKGGALPYLDAVKISIIPDATVRFGNLRAGEIDLDITALPKDVSRIKEDPNLKVIIQDGVILEGTFWNLSRPPFNNINFRRAVSHAINREALVKVITFGISKPFNGIIMPAHAWAFDTKRPMAKYDPVLAKQYLDKAVAEGGKAEWTTYVPSRHAQIAEMMQADCAKVGIKMNIRAEETTTSASRYWTTYEIDSITAGYAMSPDPYSKIYVAHHSQGFYTPEKGTAGKGWDSPEGYFAKFDKSLEAANKTYDPKKRATFFYEASQALEDNVGFLGLFYSSQVFAARKNVEGVTGGGDGRGRFDRAWLNQ